MAPNTDELDVRMIRQLAAAAFVKHVASLKIAVVYAAERILTPGEG